jgi:hypothetical protein
MKTTMLILAVLLGLGLGVIALVAIGGYLLPVSHMARRTIMMKVPVDRVWAAISDFKGSVSWREDLASVEQVEQTPGVFAWRELAKNGEILTYLTLEASPEKKLVRKIVDQGLPFGGTWTFELDSENGETKLSIVENGEVYNPIFRFVSRFVFGHHSSIDKYIAQLKRHLGEV